MQQRQLRLGDILDDYCPRERRVTNHAVVAMVEQDVKQTRCTTCDAGHEYKHARNPPQRPKSEAPTATTAQACGGPKRVIHEAEKSKTPESAQDSDGSPALGESQPPELASAEAGASAPDAPADESKGDIDLDEGPVHRQLIRATLPRPEGQPPPSR